jgi:hypothetical protein
MRKTSDTKTTKIEQLGSTDTLLKIEELEAIVAPAGTIDKLAVNHNETLVKDKTEIGEELIVVEELEAIVAPAFDLKITYNHNETLVRDASRR